VVRDGTERVVERQARVELFHPRRGEVPYLFEMGLPIEPLGVPWHVDVQQRVPLADHRESTTEPYRLLVKSLLFESLIGQWLERRDLRNAWVEEVIGRGLASDRALEQYVARVFPRGALLSGAPAVNDRARQLGGTVVEAGTMARGVYASLTRVMERAEEFVRRREHEFSEAPVEPSLEQQRFARFVRYLGERLLKRRLTVVYVDKSPTTDGFVEDASFDAATGTIKFNTRGKVDFDRPISATTLAILFHEFAHHFVLEHDQRFIEHLQTLAGQATVLLATLEPGRLKRLLEEDT
jgi:hypothetical protein